MNLNNIDVGQIKEKLQKDWEKTFFWLSLLMLLMALAFLLFNLFGTREEKFSLSTSAPKPHTLLNENALVFLDDPPVLAKGGNPFYFQKLFATKQPKKPPENKNVKPPPEKKVAVVPPPPPPPPAAPPPPVKVMTMRYRDFKTIEYRGSTKSASGETLALISVFDSKTKETKDLTIAQGDTIDDLAVAVVTSDMIVILDKKNQEQSIMLQTSEKVVEE
ncbi:MAG TPA: hypothetical protein DET40_20935 [Lentisphaeria bacterium]|nr:MAG: hypothetical protein A2X45_15555 [Lentisphaerae bacterium GWF2_50_93]HCE46018.1 hypothetical protein [Lentisphaeria bacterium]